MLFSIYTDCIQNEQFGQVSIEEIRDLCLTKRPSIHKHIDRLRAFSDAYVKSKDKSIKKTLTNLKVSMPYVTPAGVFVGKRNNASIDHYSGVVQIDVDIKHVRCSDFLIAVKQSISALPFVSLCMVSPSGYGVKAFAMTDNKNFEHHKQCVKEVNKVVRATIADIVAPIANDLPVEQIVDECGSALSQPMIITHDPEVYYNGDFTLFNFVYVEPAKVLRPERTAKSIDGVKFEVVSKPNDEQERILTNFLTRRMELAEFKLGNHEAVKLIGFANVLGIDEAVTYNFMLTNGWSNKHLVKVADIYKRYSSQFGSGQNEAIVTAPVPPIIETLQKDINFLSMSLLPGTRLSEAIDGREIERSTHIIAPTGSGKSNLKFSGKQVWVFPTTSLCHQFYTGDNGSRSHAMTVWGKSPNPDGDEDLIITTYDSCAKALTGLNVSEYTLILDEVHHYVVSSSASFKLSQLRSTLPLLAMAKMVITLTATPFHNEITEFMGFDIIKVYKKDSFKRNVYQLKSAESRIGDVVKMVKDRGNFALIFLQTTDDATLSNWKQRFDAVQKKVVFLNSLNKTDKEFIDVVTKRQVEEGTVYIATSVIAEGVSVETNLTEVDVFIMGAQHPYLIEQVSRRFREIETLNVFLLTNNDDAGEIIDEANQFGDAGEDVESNRICSASIELRSMSERVLLAASVKARIEEYEKSGICLADLNVIKSYPIYEDDGWYPDQLRIENMIFEAERNLFAGHMSAVVEELNLKYGYEICENVVMNEVAMPASNKKQSTAEELAFAQKLAFDMVFGLSVLDEDLENVGRDCFKKQYNKIRKVVDGLPGIKSLGKDKVVEIFDDFNVLESEVHTSRFIKYVQLLNSAVEVREKFRQYVIDTCANGKAVKVESLRKMGGIIYEAEHPNGGHISDRNKMEMVMALMLCFERQQTSVDGEKGYKYTPVEQRLRHEMTLVKLNIFNY